MIVVDTGVLFAAADRRDADHEACLALLDARPSAELVLPAVVAAEASWLIGDRLGAETEAAVVASDVAATRMTSPVTERVIEHLAASGGCLAHPELLT